MMLYQLALALKALGRTGAKELDEHPMVKRALKTAAAGEGPLANAQEIFVEGSSGPRTCRVSRLAREMSDLMTAENWEGVTRLDGKIRELAGDPSLTEGDSEDECDLEDAEEAFMLALEVWHCVTLHSNCSFVGFVRRLLVTVRSCP